MIEARTRLQEQYGVENPYRGSTLMAKLHMQQAERMEQLARGETPNALMIHIYDIDGTMQVPTREVGMGGPLTALEEPVHTAESIRMITAAHNIAEIALSSRTEEMLMSERNLQQTTATGDINRPVPHVARQDGRFVYQDPARVEGFRGVLDFDMQAGQTGAVIHVGQAQGGYKKDTVYEKKLGLDEARWRGKTLPIMQSILDEVRVEGVDIALEVIDRPGEYEAGNVDVAPLQYRIQINFRAQEASVVTQGTGATAGGIDVQTSAAMRAVAAKNIFKEAVRAYKRNIGGVVYRDGVKLLQQQYQLRPVEQEKKALQAALGQEAYRVLMSNRYALYEQDLIVLQEQLGIREAMSILDGFDFIDDSNPAKGRASLYIVPKEVSKQRAAYEMMQRIAKEMGEARSAFHSVYYGDSFTDLAAIQGLVDPHAPEGKISGTLVLVGDSRLTPALQKAILERNKAAEERESVDFAGEGLNALAARLEPELDEEGVELVGHYLYSPPLSAGKIRLVLGAEAYPQTAMVETVLAHTQDMVVKKAA